MLDVYVLNTLFMSEPLDWLLHFDYPFLFIYFWIVFDSLTIPKKWKVKNKLIRIII